MNEGEIIANVEFDYPFAGKTYKLKRASLKQVIAFQKKVTEFGKDTDGTLDLKMVSYALYLSLHQADSTITEEYVDENAPGDIDVMDTLQQLGFMSQQKVALLRKMQDSLANRPSGETSSAQ